MPREYCVYILTNRSGTLYIGVTGDIHRRLQQHREGTGSAFARRYRMNRVVHIECTTSVHDALRREKQLKGWTRAKKVALITATNPEWQDLLPA